MTPFPARKRSGPKGSRCGAGVEQLTRIDAITDCKNAQAISMVMRDHLDDGRWYGRRARDAQS